MVLRKYVFKHLMAEKLHWDDFDSSLLSAQLQNFGTFFSENAEKVSLQDCLVALQNISSAQKELFNIHWLSSFL